MSNKRPLRVVHGGKLTRPPHHWTHKTRHTGYKGEQRTPVKQDNDTAQATVGAVVHAMGRMAALLRPGRQGDR